VDRTSKDMLHLGGEPKSAYILDKLQAYTSSSLISGLKVSVEKKRA
jgi:hypothetical protein